MVIVELKNVSFSRHGVDILTDINLVINDREYLSIVGPTGAGKTSLIGLLSGLYTPTSGQILFNGRDVTRLPPNERHCGVMFESYALFPHLTVLDNISYARHMRESNHAETYAIGEAVLNLVRLSGRDQALPHECSGGMQQRVALARAIMALEQDGLLILDEPFKALDAGLRLNLRLEVREIAKSEDLRLTTVHVTNDMQEAMMGDRIAVLDQGKIRQIGTPGEILYEPKDLFVANFFSSELNYFNGKIIQIDPISKMSLKNKPMQKLIIQTIEGFFLFAKTENKPFWEKIYSDSISIIGKSQFGKWGLPSDWVKLSKSGIEPDTRKSPYFGYNAVRVLLYLSYESRPSYPKGLKKIFSLYHKVGYIPLNVDLERDSLSLLKAPAGFYAVYALAAKKSGQVSLGKKLFKEAENLLSKEKKSYYSFVLFLLAKSEDVFN